MKTSSKHHDDRAASDELAALSDKELRARVRASFEAVGEDLGQLKKGLTDQCRPSTAIKRHPLAALGLSAAGAALVGATLARLFRPRQAAAAESEGSKGSFAGKIAKATAMAAGTKLAKSFATRLVSLRGFGRRGR